MPHFMYTKTWYVGLTFSSLIHDPHLNTRQWSPDGAAYMSLVLSLRRNTGTGFCHSIPLSDDTIIALAEFTCLILFQRCCSVHEALNR